MIKTLDLQRKKNCTLPLNVARQSLGSHVRFIPSVASISYLIFLWPYLPYCCLGSSKLCHLHSDQIRLDVKTCPGIRFCVPGVEEESKESKCKNTLVFIHFSDYITVISPIAKHLCIPDKITHKGIVATWHVWTSKIKLTIK